MTLGLGEYAKLEHRCNVKIRRAYRSLSGLQTTSFRQTISEDIQGLPVINIRRVPLNNLLNRFVKRSVDLFGAVVALILFSPVMLITAIVIKVTSPEYADL